MARTDAEDMLPKGSLIKVEMMVRLPVAANDEQIEEWLRTGMANEGSINTKNPLISEPVEAWGSYGLTWEDTGDEGRAVDFDHEDLGGGCTQYRTRYERTPRSRV